MVRLIHLSDLHFGAVEAKRLAALAPFVEAQHCDLAVISGDLTQRARRKQFIEARSFLDGLGIKSIVVPGNHDIPLYAIWRRIRSPFARYIAHIHDDLEPSYIDDEVAILGMSTVTRWSKEGSFRPKRFRRVGEKFRALPPDVVKILVTHHPIPESAFDAGQLRFDVLLAGHTHRPRLFLRGMSPEARHVVIEAGTATSTRIRHGHQNSFNVIDVETACVHVRQYEWEIETGVFSARGEGRFCREAAGWAEDGPA